MRRRPALIAPDDTTPHSHAQPTLIYQAYRATTTVTQESQIGLSQELLDIVHWQSGDSVTVEIQHLVLKTGERVPFIVVKPAALATEEATGF